MFSPCFLSNHQKKESLTALPKLIAADKSAITLSKTSALPSHSDTRRGFWWCGINFGTIISFRTAICRWQWQLGAHCKFESFFLIVVTMRNGNFKKQYCIRFRTVQNYLQPKLQFDYKRFIGSVQNSVIFYSPTISLTLYFSRKSRKNPFKIFSLEFFTISYTELRKVSEIGHFMWKREGLSEWWTRSDFG